MTLHDVPEVARVDAPQELKILTSQIVASNHVGFLIHHEEPPFGRLMLGTVRPVNSNFGKAETPRAPENEVGGMRVVPDAWEREQEERKGMITRAAARPGR